MVLQGELAIDLMIFFSLIVYIDLALRRAYETSKTRSAISAVILSTAVGFSIALYHNLLFYTTFWAT